MDTKLYKEIGNAVEYAKTHNGDLTTQNLKYVVKCAEDLSSKTGASFEDLLAEGIIAMKKAEAKYDPSKNDSFVKFAGVSVRGYMLNFINRQMGLVSVPANLKRGFKKGQKDSEECNITYNTIDDTNCDRLGLVDNDAFSGDMYDVLMDGLSRLDENGKIAIEMKLRMGEYGEIVPTDNTGKGYTYKYKNNLQAIADELEVPITTANKIYRDAMDKLSKYCQGVYHG